MNGNFGGTPEKTKRGHDDNNKALYFILKCCNILIKYFGKQFRYVYPTCSKKQWKKLLKTSPFVWERGGYPKTKDCVWKVQTEKGKRIDCGKPPFVNIEHITKHERVDNFNNVFDCGENEENEKII